MSQNLAIGGCCPLGIVMTTTMEVVVPKIIKGSIEDTNGNVLSLTVAIFLMYYPSINMCSKYLHIFTFTINLIFYNDY